MRRWRAHENGTPTQGRPRGPPSPTSQHLMPTPLSGRGSSTALVDTRALRPRLAVSGSSARSRNVLSWHAFGHGSVRNQSLIQVGSQATGTLPTASSDILAGPVTPCQRLAGLTSLLPVEVIRAEDASSAPVVAPLPIKCWSSPAPDDTGSASARWPEVLFQPVPHVLSHPSDQPWFLMTLDFHPAVGGSRAGLCDRVPKASGSTGNTKRRSKSRDRGRSSPRRLICAAPASHFSSLLVRFGSEQTARTVELRR